MKRTGAIAIIIWILFSAVSCSKKYSNNLVTIDSLLHHELTDSAQSLLYRLNVSSLPLEDKAYYYLLLTITKHKRYIPIHSDSLINISIKTFEKNKDLYKLAYSYLYKGYILYDANRVTEALLYWKKAETTSSMFDAPELNIRILSNIAFVHAEEGNIIHSLNYCKTALSEAEKIQDKRWIGYCLNLIATLYNKKGNMDSCDYYRIKTIPYIDYQPLKERYVYYSNIAKYYWRNGDYKNAEINLRKSLALDQRGVTYSSLAELLIEQGQYQETDNLWNKAFHTDNKEDSIKTLYPYSKWLWEQNRKQEAWDIAIQIPLLKDSIAHQQQAEELQLVQSGYEQQLTEMHQHSRMQQMVIYCLCIVLVMALAGFLLWRKLQKTRQRLAESQKDTETYTLRLRMEQEEIEKLKHEQRLLENSKKRSEKEHQELESALNRRIKDKERRVKDLQRKLQSLHDEQGTMLAHGKRLYESIIQGGTTEGWRKADYVDFANYYRLDHFDFFEENSSLWDSMTPREQFFLILHDMGLEKDQILFTMQISKGAYRTLLSRIANKGE